MFLSLEGLVIGLALVGGAFVVGVVLSALSGQPRSRPTSVPPIRQRTTVKPGRIP